MIPRGMFSVSASFLLILSSVSFLARVQPVEAQARSPALERVLEGAKNEGILKIQWLAGRLDGEAGMRPMIAAMNKRYGTNVKLQFTPGPDFPTMLNKISQERAAGLPSSTDISLMAASHTAEGLKIGLLRKLDWGSVLERPAPSGADVNRVAPEGVAVMIASRVIGITYNTNLVKGDEIPVSMEDIFKPKWKGKIVSTPFGVGLTQFAAKDLLGYEYMKNYTQRLATQVGGLTACSNVDRVSSGDLFNDRMPQRRSPFLVAESIILAAIKHHHRKLTGGCVCATRVLSLLSQAMLPSPHSRRRTSTRSPEYLLRLVF